MAKRSTHRGTDHHARKGSGPKRAVPMGEGAATKRKITRQGISRKPRERLASNLPLADRHTQVLAMLGVRPCRVSDIARSLGVSPDSVNSTMYVLQDRGLVRRLPFKGWVKL